MPVLLEEIVDFSRTDSIGYYTIDVKLSVDFQDFNKLQKNLKCSPRLFNSEICLLPFSTAGNLNGVMNAGKLTFNSFKFLIPTNALFGMRSGFIRGMSQQEKDSIIALLKLNFDGQTLTEHFGEVPQEIIQNQTNEVGAAV